MRRKDPARKCGAEAKWKRRQQALLPAQSELSIVSAAPPPNDNETFILPRNTFACAMKDLGEDSGQFPRSDYGIENDFPTGNILAPS
jgi:hypothetical protein